MYDLLVITGPTAVGKTALGVVLALQMNGEVVSADSMQVYRGMNIGTAKPSMEERQGVPHYMIDVVEPWDSFSAAQYRSLASVCVEDIRRRGKVPIVVGGTGLYIDGLIRGTDYAAAPEDLNLRRSLEVEYDQIGGEAFREKLRYADPDRAAKLFPGDKKRLVRAMEIYILTGETITRHDSISRQVPPRYKTLKVALDFQERAQLYDRIDCRAEEMFRAGLVEEVQRLLEMETPIISTAMQAIGYKETAAYLAGACSLEETVSTVQRKSRQYAKRQLTWLRRDESVRWLRWEKEPDMTAAGQIISEFMGDIAARHEKNH